MFQMTRMIRALILIFSLCCATAFVHADNGLVTLKSHNSVTKTLDLFESAVRNKGMTVFARIDHRKGAAGVGLELRPTEMLIFGNPKVGTLLMQADQTAGIDLPLKALAWQDEQGAVWLSYNDPAWIVRRHDIKDRDAVVAKMQGALKTFAELSTQN